MECDKCGRDGTARHRLSLDEDDPRGDQVTRVFHGGGDHCTWFDGGGSTHE